MRRTGFKRKLLPRRASTPIAEMVRAEPIHVTTERTPGEVQQKAGSLHSEVYLAWVRKRPCYFCEGPDFQQTPTEAHHAPGKGRSGVTRDDKTIPVCRAHHCACHGLKTMQHFDGVGSEMVDPIDDFYQECAVDATFRLFMETASELELKAFLPSWLRWRESRQVVVS